MARAMLGRSFAEFQLGGMRPVDDSQWAAEMKVITDFIASVPPDTPSHADIKELAAPSFKRMPVAEFAMLLDFLDFVERSGTTKKRSRHEGHVTPQPATKRRQAAVDWSEDDDDDEMMDGARVQRMWAERFAVGGRKFSFNEVEDPVTYLKNFKAARPGDPYGTRSDVTISEFVDFAQSIGIKSAEREMGKFELARLVASRMLDEERLPRHGTAAAALLRQVPDDR